MRSFREVGVKLCFIKMGDRYWKWVVNGTTERIYRLKNGEFEKFAQNRWQISDRYERAVQDPEFVEIGKLEADELIKTVGANT